MTTTVTVPEFLKSMDADPQIIDVRSPSEFATGHVPGAINVPLEQIESRVADFVDHRPLVLVCQSGKRASMAAERLSSLRFDVQVLEGGISAWRNSGLDTVSTARTRWSLERQVRLGAGVLILASIGLSFAWNPAWLALTAFVGAGLTFAGLTNICGMGVLLERMPWNRPAKPMQE